jgi:hypothetical protein
MAEDCPACCGEGEYDCGTCDGSGTDPNNREMSCDECVGTGKVECDGCDGEGAY